MGIASLILGMLAFLLGVAGIFIGAESATAGLVVNIIAPILAVAGIVFAGLEMSKTKRTDGNYSGLSITALVISIVAFCFSSLVAVTCGLCNACVVNNGDAVTDRLGVTRVSTAHASCGGIAPRFHPGVDPLQRQNFCAQTVLSPGLLPYETVCPAGMSPVSGNCVQQMPATPAESTAFGHQPDNCDAYQAGTSRVVVCGTLTEFQVTSLSGF